MFRRLLPLIVLITTCLVACDRGPEKTDDGADVYRVRAIVRQLPVADQPGSELHLQHEEIPSFRNVAGERVGMNSMTMPFPVADDVDMSSVEIGDRIEVDLKVDWDGSPPVEILSIDELSPGTVLDFEDDLPAGSQE